MLGLNKMQILGRLGQDPKTVITHNGTTITTLSVATNEQWYDELGTLRTSTEWHRITLFGGLATTAQNHLKKGDLAFFEGKLKTQRYTDKQGISRWVTGIYADSLEMLSPKKSNNSHANANPRTTAKIYKNSKIDSDLPW